MRKQWKGVLLGIFVSVLWLEIVGTATATVGQRTVSVDYNDIKVTLNGAAVNMVDADGVAVEPFIINGTTYLPVRAVASALGLDVNWNGQTKTVELNKSSQPHSTQVNYNGEKHLIKPGEVFQKGSYIYFENVEILYDGEMFLIRNDRDDIIRITEAVVGIKTDGTYEILQSGGPYGIDKTRYEKDLAENGWAIEHSTNMVRPGETLEATATIFDFGQDLDVDSDGYYDIMFTISPQKSEDMISFSSTDPQTKTYKFIAN